MLFTSLSFAVFLPVTWALYWLVRWPRLRLQNALVLAASCLFYGWWDWRFLGLIAISTGVDYTVGLALDQQSAPPRRKALLAASVLVNLGILGYFKYFGFFAASLQEALSWTGLRVDFVTANVLLPVGISFYTFQTLSYTFDVYRRQIRPTRDLVAFAAFVSFFPQLVAGPIERASRLLPQFTTPRQFERKQATTGLTLILWGLAKKVLVADLCGESVDRIFARSASASSAELWLGACFFAFQIYGDFSGYSDIARGTAKLFGVELMVNFRTPYFAASIPEFWHRWHISLSTWFRDYLYIPLGGSRRGPLRTAVNVMSTFLVSGLWHGANWTFVVWGGLHGLYYLVAANLPSLGASAAARWSRPFRVLLTFFLTVVGWVFFRAESVGHAIQYLTRAFTAGGPVLQLTDPMDLVRIGLIVALMLMEWRQGDREHGLALGWAPRPLRWLAYSSLAVLILVFTAGPREFIYFQF